MVTRVTVGMSSYDPPPPPPQRGGGHRNNGNVALMVGTFLAVFLAGALCAITVIALTALGTHTARLAGVDEAETPATQEESGGTSDSEQEEQEEERESETDEGGQASPEHPEESGTDQGSPQDVPPSSYDGTSTTMGQFRVDCEVAYTDTSITDGMGSYAYPPSGHEYHIYRLHVTNEGDTSQVFDVSGSTALTTDGREFFHDDHAETTVAWDYFWEEITPGRTVTTYVVFTAPQGTQFSEVRLDGATLLEPR